MRMVQQVQIYLGNGEKLYTNFGELKIFT